MVRKLVQNTHSNISTVFTTFTVLSTYRTCSLDRILVFHYTLAKAIHLEYPNSSPVVASWQRSVSCCLPDPWIREEVHRRNCIRNTPNPDAVSRSLQWTNQKLKKFQLEDSVDPILIFQNILLLNLAKETSISPLTR